MVKFNMRMRRRRTTKRFGNKLALRKPLFKRRFLRSNAPKVFYPIGYRHAAKFVYSQTVTMNPTAGVCDDYIFRANSLYDPDYTGTGHQPYGFDEMMAFYNHFTVVGSKITAFLSNNNATQCWMGIKLLDNATSLAGIDPDSLIEKPGYRFKMLGGYQGGGNTKTVTQRFSAAKFFSVNKGALLAADHLRGSVSGNPADSAYFHLLFMPQGSEDFGNQVITVRIEYYAVLTEPTILPAS